MARPLVTRPRTVFHHSADVRLVTGIAFAGHTGTAGTTDFFVPRLLRVIFANPPDAVTDFAVRIYHQPMWSFLPRASIAFDIACASLSDWRSRSICFRKFTGNSRSSSNDPRSNDARSRSPISLTIARLWRESMSTEFRWKTQDISSDRHDALLAVWVYNAFD